MRYFAPERGRGQHGARSNVDELNGNGTCPSSGESAARTAQAMEAILAEFREATGAAR